MQHITGQQARQLLEGTTPGPWHVDYSGIETEDGDVIQPVDKDAWLIAAAPDLAETVAWLYGKNHSLIPSDMTVTWVVGDRIEVDACLEPGEKVQLSSREMGGEWLTMHADEAVELARALLAAAEEARREE